MRRIILTDLDRGTVHEFRDADVRIGRDAACELQIAEAPASAEIGGVHARLAPRPTGWCLTDERSAGGTFVNHVRLVGNDQAILRTGDVLRLGSGAGARRFRVARVESAMAAKRAPATAAGAPAAVTTVKQEASDLRLAAGAVGGAVAATVAAAVPRATNAQLAAGAAAGTAVASAGVAAASGLAAKGKGASGPTGRQTSSAALSGAAAAGAVAATGGVAGVAAVGGTTEAWRASTIFRAAGESASIAPKASAASLWAGVVAGTVLVTASATGIATARGDSGEAGQSTSIASAATATGGAAARPTGATSAGAAAASANTKSGDDSADETPAAARLSATAAAVGNILADIEGWRGGTRLRLTGLVIGEGGVAVTSDALGAGGRVDSIVAHSPYGGTHRGQLVSRNSGVAVVSLPTWDGQWLGQSAVGSATTIPTWSAVVGYDRMNAKTMLAAAEGAAAMTSSAIEVRGVSDRLLPGAALVSEEGRVVGLWLGDGRAMPMQQVLSAARDAGQRAR